MKRGPLFTLLAVIVLAATLMALNLTRSGGPAPRPAQAAANANRPAPTAPPTSAPAASAPAVAAAPAPATPFPEDLKFAGHADSPHRSVAVTVHDGKVSAYLCDGQSIEAWYTGTAAGNLLAAIGRAGNSLTGTLNGSTLTGIATAHGTSWSYSATPVTKPAGLYRSKRGSVTVGWIKQADGSVTGLANDGGVEEPAPPLDPASAQWLSGGDVVMNR